MAQTVRVPLEKEDIPNTVWVRHTQMPGMEYMMVEISDLGITAGGQFIAYCTLAREWEMSINRRNPNTWRPMWKEYTVVPAGVTTT